jgi:putative phosphoribosyl transferase
MRITPLFRDRADAGRALATHVIGSVPDANVIVLALPRGGVPVGFELARALRAQFDVFLVRKLGLPGEEELAIGAIASGGVRVLNEQLIQSLGLSKKLIDRLTEREEKELQRRELLYREGRPAAPVAGRVTILVDDGLATGATMKAACRALRLQDPQRIVVAVPVASRQACGELRTDADQIICADTPDPFIAVGIWYDDFSQTTDEAVKALLKQAAQQPTA